MNECGFHEDLEDYVHTWRSNHEPWSAERFRKKTPRLKASARSISTNPTTVRPVLLQHPGIAEGVHAKRHGSLGHLLQQKAIGEGLCIEPF